ncbi:MAG: helix-turn-helix domain-containing protein [Opitutales bacterium]
MFATLSGCGRFFSPEGQKAHARAGQLHLYDLGAAQDYGTEPKAGQWVFLFAHFAAPAEWQPLLDWPIVWPGLRHLELPGGATGTAIGEALVTMNRLRQGGLPRSEWLARNALERALLFAESVNPQRAHGRLDERVSQAMALMGQRFGEALTLSQIARSVGLSESRLAHLFREQTGQTVLEHLEGVRLRHARELLEWTGQPIHAIAEHCGFSSAFYFSTRFRKATELSPTAYRRQRQGPA